MKCKNCGTENLDGSRFCERCGSALDIKPTKNVAANDLRTRQCRKCGALLDATEKFCPICGDQYLGNEPASYYNQNRSTNNPYAPKQKNAGIAPSKSSSKMKLIIGIVVGIVLCLVIVGGIFFLTGKGSGDVLDETQLESVSITSWDWDWDSCREAGDVATVDIIMNVENGSDSDISGIAFTAANAYGSNISNESDMYTPDTPFYSEGFVASGSNGIMICSATVRLSEKTLYRAADNMPLAGESEIKEAYLFLGEDGYTVPHGTIVAKHDVDGGVYDVEITNDNDSEIKSDSSKVVMGYYADGFEVKDADATGVLKIDIPPYDTVVERNAFTDPNLWGSITQNTYWVYVIDNSYGDGKFYFDTYQENYGKDE